jgi:hypothetical protein
MQLLLRLRAGLLLVLLAGPAGAPAEDARADA